MADFNDIPDIPDDMPAASAPRANTQTGAGANGGNTYIKQQPNNQRKMFANKKANIAIGIAFGVIAIAIIAAVIYGAI